MDTSASYGQCSAGHGQCGGHVLPRYETTWKHIYIYKLDVGEQKGIGFSTLTFHTLPCVLKPSVIPLERIYTYST